MLDYREFHHNNGCATMRAHGWTRHESEGFDKPDKPHYGTRFSRNGIDFWLNAETFSSGEYYRVATA